MAWMSVLLEIENHDPVPNVVNIDSIVRYGPRGSGSYLKMADGSTLDLVDSFDEITQVILKAQEKRT